MIYDTYFSDQEWSHSNGDAVKLIASRHELTQEYKIEVLSFTKEAHGVILSYSITY
jgi:hypothetical protein